MQRFADTFLAGESLVALFTYSCNASISFVEDPITDVVISMLRAPVMCVLSAKGLQPFRGAPNIVLPYVNMTAAQRALLVELLTGAEDGSVKCARRNNCVELLFESAPARPLAARDVLLCMCDAVVRSEDSADGRRRLAVCNILLQRVRGSVNVAHDVLVFLHTRVRSMLPDETFKGAGASGEGDEARCERPGAGAEACAA